jgi:hypothetical protein
VLIERLAPEMMSLPGNAGTLEKSGSKFFRIAIQSTDAFAVYRQETDIDSYYSSMYLE